MPGKNCFQPLFNQVYIRLRRRNTGFRLFLKRMQNMNCITYTHSVDRAKSIAPMVFH